MNENKANDSGAAAPRSGTQVALLSERKSIRELAKSVLSRDARPKTEPSISAEESGEIRTVRRGKFFLSDFEQRMYGSLRRPIFQYWGHGVIVGETQSGQLNDQYGVWCYAAHNDFDLIPAGTSLNEWPEYIRTPTGWIRLVNPDPVLPRESLDAMLKNLSNIKRLK